MPYDPSLLLSVQWCDRSHCIYRTTPGNNQRKTERERERKRQIYWLPESKKKNKQNFNLVSTAATEFASLINHFLLAVFTKRAEALFAFNSAFLERKAFFAFFAFQINRFSCILSKHVTDLCILRFIIKKLLSTRKHTHTHTHTHTHFYTHTHTEEHTHKDRDRDLTYNCARQLKLRIVQIIPTHFDVACMMDCLGALLVYVCVCVHVRTKYVRNMYEICMKYVRILNRY